MSIETRSVDVAGAKAAYRESGQGEVVLYLHGFPTSGYLWRDVMVELSGFRAIAPDFPGFGDSDLMGRPHTWEGLKSWVTQFLDVLDIEEVHLGVHDWGGLIGLPWMCENPARVKTLLITDTSFSPRDRWHALATQWREPGVGEEIIGQITKEGLGSLLSVSGSELPEDAIVEYWKCLDSTAKQAAKLEMYRSLDFPMFEPYMADFPRVAGGKTCIVWGESDPFVPAKVAGRFGETLGTEPTVLHGAGHFLQEDQGREVGILHSEFLMTSV